MDVEQTAAPQPEASDKQVEMAAVYAAIAERVRADSGAARLTRFEAIAPLMPEPEKLRAVIAAMLAAPGHEDIRWLVGPQGARYLYSEKTVSAGEAEKIASDNEIRDRIAAKVRGDSSQLNKLTPVAGLGAMIPGAEPDMVNGQLLGMAADEAYQDIAFVSTGAGKRFMYSKTSMTEGYASILARAEVGDPCRTVAATVREDSRVYPRPTNAAIFAERVFGINPDEISHVIRQVLSREEFRDIKQITASTGATYLYSNLYLNEDWVQATIEWEEVGRYQNP